MFSFIDAIPAKQTVTHNESLNILGGVANSDGAGSANITLWGKIDSFDEREIKFRVRYDLNDHE